MSHSDNAKQLLDWLASLPDRPDKRVVSGQHIMAVWVCPERYDMYISAVHEKTGRWIALAGVDYAFGEWLEPGQNSTLVDHWNDGGLIEISWHAFNPWTGSGPTWTGGQWHDTSGGDLSELYTPGNSAYDMFHADLDIKASWLADLRDNGVVVLWRPFHEMNALGFSWWSHRDQGEFVALWRHVFDYFTTAKGLDNLLWVYAPDRISSENTRSVLYYWPGDEYVDIVGLDYYLVTADMSDMEAAYSELLSTGKPFALTECGPTGWLAGDPDPAVEPDNAGWFEYDILIQKIREHCPKAIYFLPWHSNWAIINQLNAQELLDDSWVITRDEVNWKEEGGNMTLKAELETLRTELDALTSADLAAMVTSLDAVIVSLTTLRTDLSALDMVDKTTMIAHVDSALGQLADFEAAKEATLGIE